MRSDRAPERLLAATALAIAAAAVTLAATATRSASEEQRSRDFQLLVDGLGWGGAVSLGDCAASFDPSIEAVCTRGLDPVAGAFAFCIHHAGPTIRR